MMVLKNIGLRWKLRKFKTYVRLFGLRWTIAKVRSQRHLGRTAAPVGRFDNAACATVDSPIRQVAIVGCGNFAFSVVAYYLSRENPEFLRATLDINHARAVSLCRSYRGAYATRDIADILTDDSIKIVYITSNHATHATYARQFIEAGKAVHIEKPHAVDAAQLAGLAEAMRQKPSVPVFLGFNRPRSPHFTRVVSAMSSQPGPAMLAWFIAGHAIPDDHWYFAESEGGRVLGNLCHWLDASMQLVGEGQMFPCTLIPTSRPDSKSDFVLTIDCADGTIVTISFSAKGETFEGIREVLNAHRGDCLVFSRDFHETRIHRGSTRLTYRTRLRDHGHRSNVLNSYRRATAVPSADGESLTYVLNSGWLGLAARHALEHGDAVALESSALTSSPMRSPSAAPLGQSR